MQNKPVFYFDCHGIMSFKKYIELRFILSNRFWHLAKSLITRAHL